MAGGLPNNRAEEAEEAAAAAADRRGAEEAAARVLRCEETSLFHMVEGRFDDGGEPC